MNQRHLAYKIFLVMTLAAGHRIAIAQSTDTQGSAPSFGSIATPHPINPASNTTNPSARATQTLNPYLGSASEEKVVDGVIKLTLEDAIERGIKFNLGLIDSKQADAKTRAEREHAFSELLPQISARVDQTFQQVSFESIGIKLPPGSGIVLPPTSGSFGYSEARVYAQSPVVNLRLLDRYRQQKVLEQASMLSTRDAQDVVVFTVGAAYFQVIASEARLATVKAALNSAEELNRQVEDQFKSEVSPEIDSLKAKVELSTAQQRVVDAANDLEKDKLTLDRITGIPLAQLWETSGVYDYADVLRPQAPTEEKPSRFDLASSKEDVNAAELELKAARAERLPDLSFTGNYGGGGYNPANYNQVYLVQGTISVPVFTSGKIRSDIHSAQASLAQRRAEYRDIQGRVEYDIRTAHLDLDSSISAVKVALQNRELADKALTQSRDRFNNGVANYLEVLEAEEAQVAAEENYVGSLFSYNVAKISLARALGDAESHLTDMFGRH